MLLSTININRCGRWQKIRLIFNAIGCCNFGTIPAVGTRPNCSNMLVLKCYCCIQPITSSHLQLQLQRYFNQTAAMSTTPKSLTKAAAITGNEQQPKTSESIETNVQDAYKIVAVLDRMIGQLPAEEPTNTEGVAQHVLAFKEEGIKTYEFYRSIVWHQESGQWHVYFRSVKIGEKHRERESHCPIRGLPELRQLLAKMLAEEDGTQQIDEMPTVPEWATRDALNIGQQEQQPNDEEEEKVTAKKADAEDCPCST